MFEFNFSILKVILVCNTKTMNGKEKVNMFNVSPTFWLGLKRTFQVNYSCSSEKDCFTCSSRSDCAYFNLFLSNASIKKAKLPKLRIFSLYKKTSSTGDTLIIHSKWNVVNPTKDELFQLITSFMSFKSCSAKNIELLISDTESVPLVNQFSPTLDIFSNAPFLSKPSAILSPKREQILAELQKGNKKINETGKTLIPLSLKTVTPAIISQDEFRYLFKNPFRFITSQLVSKAKTYGPANSSKFHIITDNLSALYNQKVQIENFSTKLERLSEGNDLLKLSFGFNTVLSVPQLLYALSLVKAQNFFGLGKYTSLGYGLLQLRLLKE